MKKNQHLVPHGKDWAVKGEGTGKSTAITNTKAEAIKIATDIAKHQKSKLVIHGKKRTDTR